MNGQRIVFSIFIVAILYTGLRYFQAEAIQSEPEGNLIAFVANKEDSWDLFVMQSDGTDVVQLTHTPVDESSPSWDPSGQRIVYATSDGKLQIIDLSTKEVNSLPLAIFQGKYVQPDISPNGDKIAYVYFRSRKIDDTDLAIFDLTKGSLKILLVQRSSQFFPCWSPTGETIVYVNTLCGLECGQIVQELWLAEASGRIARQIAMTNSLCMQPAWSPDGKKIAFSTDKSGNHDIWILQVDSGVLEQVTTHPASDTDPSWSSDGERIAFTSTRSGMMEIWVMDKNGRNLKVLHPFGQGKIGFKDPDWR